MSTFSNENHVTRGFTSDAINEFAFRLVCQIGLIIIDKFQNNFPKTVEWVYCYMFKAMSILLLDPSFPFKSM